MNRVLIDSQERPRLLTEGEDQKVAFHIGSGGQDKVSSGSRPLGLSKDDEYAVYEDLLMDVTSPIETTGYCEHISSSEIDVMSIYEEALESSNTLLDTPRPDEVQSMPIAQVVTDKNICLPPSATGIKDYNDNDVLCGRGGATNKHPGNRFYREFVHLHRPAYVQVRKNEKPPFSRAIVRAIRAKNGRFLKREEGTGLWFEIGDKAAREKTGQALRQGAPEMRKLVFEFERAKARKGTTRLVHPTPPEFKLFNPILMEASRDDDMAMSDALDMDMVPGIKHKAPDAHAATDEKHRVSSPFKESTSYGPGAQLLAAALLGQHSS